MAIPKITGVSDWNDANPCCCPLPACVFAEIEINHRDAEVCKGGYQPFGMIYSDPEAYPSAFDYRSFGTLIPVYKRSEQKLTQERSGTTTWTFTEYIPSEFQKPREEWEPYNQPYGDDVPFSGFFVKSTGGLSASSSAPVDGEVTVTLSWTDNRDAELGTKVGYYHVMIDGGSSFSVIDDTEVEIVLSETDTSCHEFQVRHVFGEHAAGGEWSAPVIFSLTDNPCCEAEELACNQSTEGNFQGTMTNEEKEDLPHIGGTPDSIVEEVFPEHSWIIKTWSDSGGTETQTDGTELSNDQNIEGVTLTMFGEIETLTSTWADSYGWGISLPPSGDGILPIDAPPAGARCVEFYPETEGVDFYGRSINVRRRQLRFRWYIPTEHLGTTYKVSWKIARFPEAWVKWRVDYYNWAVAKYEFLNKPEEGDDDYPVLEDFEDDPETPEDERVAALADAIAAINAIPDPGDPPIEPEDKPQIIEEPEPWEWFISQEESGPESIDACDPTRPARQPEPPVEPDPDDFEDFDEYLDAVIAWGEAMDAFEAAEEERAAASKRQSPWYFLTPDRASDYHLPPTPPAPLPEDPTEEQEELFERLTDRYEYLLAQYPERIHESVQICDVRYSCSSTTPAGPIENYDTAFYSTELPDLDPAAFNPDRFVDWYNYSEF